MVEMRVVAEQWQSMLPHERGDPKIIVWNRRSGVLQFAPDRGVMACSLRVHTKDIREPFEPPKFCLQLRPQART